MSGIKRGWHRYCEKHPKVQVVRVKKRDGDVGFWYGMCGKCKEEIIARHGDDLQSYHIPPPRRIPWREGYIVEPDGSHTYAPAL